MISGVPSPADRLLERLRADGARPVARHAADRYRDERARRRWEWAARFRREPLAEPELVEIDPNGVDHVLAHYPSGREGHYLLGVFGGSWDRDWTRIETLAFYRALFVHFRQGIPWSGTDGYRRARRSIKNGGSG